MDLINQSIANMALLPPHCPMNPNTYASFYNDSNKLPGDVAPYKLENVKHPRDGIPFQKLEYNNFYTDWKQDALKWYPRGSKEYEYQEQNQKINEPLPHNNSVDLYEQTRRNNAFAIPLPTNGTNQVSIIFNDKCNVPTFHYKRYAAQPVNNTEWFYNKLYIEDITEETQEQNAQYMDSLVQNNMDIYSSVLEDMYLLQLNSNTTDNIEYIRKTY